MFEQTDDPTEHGPEAVGTTFIQGCARCDGYHDVEVFEFEQPPGGWKYWAMCPASREPILIEEVDGE